MNGLDVRMLHSSSENPCSSIVVTIRISLPRRKSLVMSMVCSLVNPDIGGIGVRLPSSKPLRSHSVSLSTVSDSS